jgi:hypothetical protein
MVFLLGFCVFLILIFMGVSINLPKLYYYCKAPQVCAVGMSILK